MVPLMTRHAYRSPVIRPLGSIATLTQGSSPNGDRSDGTWITTAPGSVTMGSVSGSPTNPTANAGATGGAGGTPTGISPAGGFELPATL